jgi:hypothetical protein
MKFLCFSILLFSHATNASSYQLSDLLNQFISINNSFDENPQCIESDDFLSQQCARDLCGDPAELITGAITDENFDDYIEVGVKEKISEITAPVKKIFASKKRNFALFLKSAKEKLAVKDTIIDLEMLTEEEYERLSDEIFRKYLSQTIDYSKPIEDRVSYNIILSIPSKLFEKGLNAYISRLTKFSTYEAIEEEIYTEEETKKIIKDKFLEISASYKEGLKANPDLKIFSNDLIELGLSALDSENSVWQNRNVYVQLLSLQENLYGKLGKEFSPVEIELGTRCPEDCKQAIKDYLRNNNLKETLNDAEKYVAKYTDDVQMAKCTSGLIMAGLKKAKEENFQKFYPELKKRFVQNVFKNSSHESMQAFQNYIDNDLNFSFIEKHEGAVDEFIYTLKNDAELLENSDNSFPEKDFELLIRILLYKDEIQLRYDYNVCPDSYMKPHSIADAFYGKNLGPYSDMVEDKDNIVVSPFSCNHQDIGEGFIAHELGHALSSLFFEGILSDESMKKYNKVRACVASSYVNPIKKIAYSLIQRSEDSYKTEEDMADVISFIASPKTKFLCSLLEIKENGSKYDTTLEIADDPHSSNFLRVIREATYKMKTLPDSCSKVIERNRDKFRFETCI